MNQVLIAEGCDGSGKSTLAASLVAQGWERWHEGPPPEGRDQLAYYGLKLWNAAHHDKPVVFDRLHIGEMVYGPVSRDQDTLGYYGLKLMNRAIRAIGAKLILCQPPWDVVQRNWLAAERPEYLRGVEQLFDVYHRYQALFYAAGVDEVYDYTKGGFAGGAKRALPSGLIGSPNAKYLVVGEQANQAQVDWPFFASNGSSRFLNEALWEAGYLEDELAFVNARDLKGAPNNCAAMALNLPKLERLLALGEVASVWSKQALPSFVTDLPHPAYWKRFYGSPREAYVKKLKEARVG